jgi:glycerophosphoryl diester phosphodiesterase
VSRVSFPAHSLISWHRGGGETEPSASRAAFVTAARACADLVEVDVRAFADGTLVCVHDPTLPDGTTVTTATRATHPDVFTFAAFLDDLDREDPDRRVGVHLDLKGSGYEIPAAEAVRARHRPYFATTSHDASIRRLRDAFPEDDAFLTLGQGREGRGRVTMWRVRLSELVPLRRLRRTGATGVAAHMRLTTRFLRWWCQRTQRRVVVWTVDGNEALHRWLHSSVNVVTTNRPRAALAARDAVSHGTTPSGRATGH